MLKKIIYTLLILFLCAFVFPMDIMADNGRKKVVRSNWPVEYMGSNYTLSHGSTGVINFPDVMTNKPVIANSIPSTYGYHIIESACIMPNNSGEIEIGLSYFVRNSVYAEGCLPIYLTYTVGNTSNVLSESQMDQTPASYDELTAYGVSFYDYNYGESYTKYSKTITVDLSDLLYSNGFVGTFDYSIKLVTINESSYPVGNYPDLFLEYDNENFDENAPYIPEYIAGTKTFCNSWNPNNPPYFPGFGYVQTDSPTTIAETKQKVNERLDISSNNKLLSLSNTMEQVEVFPNPFNNAININNIGDDINIRVVDINGRLIYKEHIDLLNMGSTIKLDTNTWSKGLYFCQLESATEVKVVKLYK